MSSQTILNPVSGVAILGLLIYRQLRSRPVRQRLVLALAVHGLIDTVDNVQKLRAASAARR